MNTVTLKCCVCDNSFSRTKSEYNRSKRLGRKSFCSRSCSVTHGNKVTPRGTTEHLRGRQKDEYSSFRWFVRTARTRSKTRKRLGNTDLTLEYLKELWNDQKGICPLTGWELILPEYSDGWKSEPRPDRASLDRIDNDKGYIQGNVRFTAWMANICRGAFPDEEVIKFAKAIVLKTK